jgi:tRNA(Ile)-lysidine synthase
VKVVEGDLIIDRTALRRQSPEIIRRILSAGLRWVAAEDYPPRRESLADAEVAIFVGRNTTLHGCMILTSDLTIRLTRELKAVARLASPSDQSWDGRWRLDGPHAPGLEIRALGEAVKDCPNWRDTGLPRASLLASPAVWRGDTLVAAPLAGLENGWRASATGRGTFAQFLLSR